MDKFIENTEGIFPGLPESIYRQAPGENFSRLKWIAKSPKAYRWNIENPQPRTPAMIFGSIVHAMLLEPDTLSDLIVTRPEKWDSFRTKEAREWRDAQTAMVVTGEELEEMNECAQAVKEHPHAAWILQRAEKEVAVFRRHTRTGLLLKGRLDLPFMDKYGNTAIADIKKVQSVKPALFSKAIGERLYQVQGASYMDLLGATSFYFIAVEEAPPHEVAVYKLSSASIERGRARYETMLDQLVVCTAENRWPGSTEDFDDIPEIAEPVWAQREIDTLPY